MRESQELFDIPTQETVDSMLRDYNNQVEGKRNKSLLNDYNYCKFVLECVEIQRDCLERIASLANTEVNQDDQESVADITDVMNVEKYKM